jgi:transaldolase/glucose-6-phosphate isomerase
MTGWQTSAATAPTLVKRISLLREELVSEFILRDIVVLGIGGSALGIRMLADLYAQQLWEQGVRLRVLDTTEPRTVTNTLLDFDVAHGLVIVASKSGSSFEPISLGQLFFTHLTRFFGSTEQAAAHFLSLSDADTPLTNLAMNSRWRGIIVTPDNVGGRFSVLTAFGLAPLILAGIDVGELLASAHAMQTQCLSPGPNTYASQHQSPAVNLADLLYGQLCKGRNKLLLTCERTSYVVALWLEQLLAESLGKNGIGLIPVVTCAERTGALVASGAGDVMEITIPAPTPTLLGSEIVRWMFTVYQLGIRLGINPFDQPDVEVSKQATRRILESSMAHPGHPSNKLLPLDFVSAAKTQTAPSPVRLAYSGEEAMAPANLSPELYAALAQLLQPDSYLTLLAWTPCTPENNARLEMLAFALEQWCHRPVCIGFGPRYLHSTGQLHKGGPANGVFLFIVKLDSTDLAIPGAPYTLQQLYQAQQAGDLETLIAQGKRILVV